MPSPPESSFELDQERIAIDVHSGDDSIPVKVEITNTGNNPLQWTAMPSESWIRLNGHEGEEIGRIDAGETAQLLISIYALGMQPGEHHGEVAIQTADELQTVNVTAFCIDPSQGDADEAVIDGDADDDVINGDMDDDVTETVDVHNPADSDNPVPVADLDIPISSGDSDEIAGNSVTYLGTNSSCRSGVSNAVWWWLFLPVLALVRRNRGWID